MRIDILTLFPDMFAQPLGTSIIGRAVQRGLVDIRCHQIRDFTENRQNQVDDYPYGGGQGCVMQVQPLHSCWRHVTDADPRPGRTIYFSPQGKVFTQADARRLQSGYSRLILVCGHYEGVDQRFIDQCVDEELSLGDFVLTGGEIPAMAVADAVCRLIPGVLSEEACFTDESHWSGLLEYPHYSRPETWQGQPVPPVLISGNHQEVAKWRRKQSLLRTAQSRPDLFRRRLFSKADLKLLDELKAEETGGDVAQLLSPIHTGRITVRPTGEADYPRLAKLKRPTDDPLTSGDDLSATIDRLRKNRGYRHYSIYADGLGFCGEAWLLTGPEKGEAQVSVRLLPHARGGGIGGFALAHVLDAAFSPVEEITMCYVSLPEGPVPCMLSRLGFSTPAGGDRRCRLDRAAWQGKTDRDPPQKEAQ